MPFSHNFGFADSVDVFKRGVNVKVDPIGWFPVLVSDYFAVCNAF